MRIGIAGLGLIGASLGGALRRARHEVCGFDRRPAVVEEAVQRGFVDRAVTEEKAVVAEVDVLILATPPRSLISSLGRLGPRLRPGAVLTDVCSVKRPIVEGMDELPEGTRAVGGHPIAGKEHGGIASACPELFEGAPYAIVRCLRSDDDAVKVVSSLVEDIGARPVLVDAAEHDRILARTSHLPQALSTALAICHREGDDMHLKGTGLAGMLRLAAADDDLWSQIFTYNASALAASIHEVAGILSEIAELGLCGDTGGLRRLIRQGAEAVE